MKLILLDKSLPGMFLPRIKNHMQERAPTLREALKFTKKNEWSVNVEIKVIPSLVKEIEMTERIVDLIKLMHPMLNRRKENENQG